MSELRLNPLLGRWVTVATDRRTRPSSFDIRHLPVEHDPNRPCPFCPGNEEDTPPALVTDGPSGAWRVRVVPNRYPAFEGDEQLMVRHLGPVFTRAKASGVHEVLVLSPDHQTSFASLDDEQVEAVMDALQDRVAAHAAMPSVRYSQVIINRGREAGASLDHPHGQLLGVPFVPGELADEEAGFARFVGGCLMCTTLEAEVESGERVVAEDGHAVALAPYWSGTPYELLIIPRAHEAHLDKVKPADLHGVGQTLRDMLARLQVLLGDIAYNVVFHASPHRHDGDFHWHVHLLPKVTTRAGFELGTGVLINIVAPEQAAADLNGLGG